MKKIALTLVAAIAFCGVSMSQNQFNKHRQHSQKPNPEVQAQRITEHMAKEYKLTDEQKAELLELNKEYAGKVNMPPMNGHRTGINRGNGNHLHGHRMGFPNPAHQPKAQNRPEMTDEQKQQLKEQFEKRQEERENTTKEYNKKLKKILTKEQYKDYEEKQAKRQTPRRQQQ